MKHSHAFVLIAMALATLSSGGCASVLTKQAWERATEPRPAVAWVAGTLHDENGAPNGLVVRYGVRGAQRSVRTLVIPVDRELYAAEPYGVDEATHRAVAFSHAKDRPFPSERAVLASPRPDRYHEVEAAVRAGRFRAVNALDGIGMNTQRVGGYAWRAAPVYYSTIPATQWRTRPADLAQARRYALVPGTVPRPFEGLESASRVAGAAVATPVLLVADAALTVYWYVGMSIAGATGAFEN